MKLVYIIALGHSGSTLADCILGSHPQIHSSGEMRYLQWQLKRTLSEEQSVANQNVCSCGEKFRECSFWRSTIDLVSQKVSIDVSIEPMKFETAFFDQAIYEGNGHIHRSLMDKAKTSLFRRYLQRGYPLRYVKWIEPKIDKWINNNWLLYESMSTVAQKPVIIDSSKHLTFALFLQQSRPKDVIFLFLHRSIEGLAASYKKRAQQKGKAFSIDEVVKRKRDFNVRINLCKKSIPNLSYLDISYEEMAESPLKVLNNMAEVAGLKKLDSSGDVFKINPSEMHLVAGNPMRYLGEQTVQYDNRWRDRLTSEEKEYLKSIKV